MAQGNSRSTSEPRGGVGILAAGPFDPSQVKMEESPSKLKRDPELEKFIDEGWNIKKKIAEERGYNFFNGPLVRFEGFEKSKSGVAIKFSNNIMYRDVVGLRARPFMSFMENLGPDFMPNAISVLTILVTSDDMIIFRFRKSGDWDEYFETSGGFARMGEASPFETSAKRLFDDFRLEEKDVIDHRMLGLYDYFEISETTSLMMAKTSKTSEEIRQGVPDKLLIFSKSRDSITGVLNGKDKLHEPSRVALEIYERLQK